MVISKSNNIFVTGKTNALNSEMVIAAYNVTGNLLWQDTYTYDSGGACKATNIAIDNDENIVAGGIYSLELFANQYPLGSLHDRYVFLKYAPDGTRFWTTTKVNPDGILMWFELENTSPANPQYRTNLIVSDNENIYVTGVTTFNGIRTLKYVQCPSQANAFRTGNNAVNNSTSTEGVVSFVFYDKR